MGNILFWGYYFPEDYLEKNIDKFFLVPFASNRLQENILFGISNISNIQLHISSFLPTVENPSSKFLWVRSIPNLKFGNNRISNLNFLNLKIFKHITKFVFLWCHIVYSFISIRGRKTILIYNYSNVYLITAYFLSFIYNIKVVVIIADMPLAGMPNENRFIKFLRKIDKFIFRSTLKSFDGLIVLSGKVIEDYFPNMKNLVLEGILSKKLFQEYSGKSINYNCSSTVVITYYGRLSSFQNVDGLIREFSKCQREDISLCICGKGELSSFIAQQANCDKRIKYLGYVSTKEMSQLINRTDYFISPKLIDNYFSRYSFPSKLIEFMVSGKPVASFKLPSIPLEYFDYLISLNETKDAFQDFFKGLKKANHGDRLRGKRGKDYILNTKNCDTQGRRIRDFLFELK